MKKKSKNYNLKIEKIKITKLNNPSSIVGGDGIGGGDGQKSILVACDPIIKQ